jgi:hypothetical protein
LGNEKKEKSAPQSQQRGRGVNGEIEASIEVWQNAIRENGVPGKEKAINRKSGGEPPHSQAKPKMAT